MIRQYVLPYTRAVTVPLQQLVLKIHSRCDLACDHCYVYEHADRSWSTRPKVISDGTVEQVAKRLASYAAEHQLESLSVILHGGEPLLAGPARLSRICAELTRTLTPVARLDLRIHTNGVQLNRNHLKVFDEFGVLVGISLDGDRAANDLHRLDRKGRSSYDRVLRAVDLLRTEEFRHLYLGLLCTVDIANDPVAVHDALTALDPPRIDYLLPHSTWDAPPSRPGPAPTPYADWLLAAFDRWEEQGRTVPVRIFESVLSTLRGGPSLTESLGLAPSDLAVVETDGSFEQADSLKTAYDGAAATGFDVFRHTFDDLAAHPGVRARQSGLDGVSETCRACPVVRSCGGGLYAHRYSAGRGFDNPSVFCPDLRAFIDGVAERTTQRALSPVVCDPEELRFAQLDLNRRLLALLHERHAADPRWDRVWSSLAELDADERVAPELDAVLAHPHTRTALLRALDEPADPARPAALAAAAVARAGAGPAVAWPGQGQELHLPTLGTLRLPGPGPVEVSPVPGGLVLRGAWGLTSLVLGPEPSAEWRPLTRVDGLLVDDADPFRDGAPAAVTVPLDGSELDLFAKRWTEARRLLDARAPGWRTGLTTLTPLVAGSGVHPAAPGALGVAVDAEPEELALGLLRAARRARLAALRDTCDLHLPHSPAGPLLEAADRWTGEAAYRTGRDRAAALAEAARALTALGLLPERELTESGAVLTARLWGEWAERHGG